MSNMSTVPSTAIIWFLFLPLFALGSPGNRDGIFLYTHLLSVACKNYITFVVRTMGLALCVNVTYSLSPPRAVIFLHVGISTIVDIREHNITTAYKCTISACVFNNDETI